MAGGDAGRAVPTVTGPVGAFTCAAPWTHVDLTPTAATLLGLPVGEVPVVELTSRSSEDVLPADVALAATLRTGQPLVLTHAFRRAAEERPRTLTTVIDLVRDGHGEAMLLGRTVDLTDTVCGGRPLAQGDHVGLALLGGAAVVVLAGELDVLARGRLVEALTAATEEGRGDIHVDTRHLRYCDARGAVTLLQAARSLHGGRRLVLVHPPAVLRRLVDVLQRAGLAAGDALVVRDLPGVGLSR